MLPMLQHGSVLLQRGDEITWGRGNFGVFFPINHALYRSYSSMDFATKDRFGLNLITAKLDIIQFLHIKVHNFD